MNRGGRAALRRGEVRRRKRQMAAGPSPVWQRVPLPVLLILLVLGVTVGLVVYFSTRSARPDQATAAPASQPPAPQPAASQPAAALVGGSAPPFTLNSASGEAYAFKPGDGKNHLLVFYMGYF